MVPDEAMQKIAAENNLAETAFYVPEKNDFHLRWFTPVAEVDLCGHATLATAHVMLQHLGFKQPQINFNSKSGMLSVRKNGELLTLNFPKDELIKTETPKAILEAIMVNPVECFKGKNVLLVVLNSQEELESINPKSNFIAQAHPHGVIITAKGNDVDFVSRCFFPNLGINEDPASGAANAAIAAFLDEAAALGELGDSYTVSQGREMSRDAQLLLHIDSDRQVWVGGHCQNVIRGTLRW